MKKLFFLATILTAVNSFAQKSQFGFTGGLTSSNYKMKMSGTTVSATSRVGFTLGIVSNFNLGNSFTIQPAINWVQKGTQQKEISPSGTMKSTLTTNHIEVPVNLVYNSAGFFIGAGPSFAFGISGKSTFEGLGQKTEEKVSYGSSDNDNLKGFDFGFNALAGYKFKSGLSVAANYNLGLSNLISGSNSDGSLRSLYGGIRLGYWLRSKKN